MRVHVDQLYFCILPSHCGWPPQSVYVRSLTDCVSTMAKMPGVVFSSNITFTRRHTTGFSDILFI